MLKRLTTEYDENEDRIRIAGESDDGQPVVIWMTHRMAHRMVPKMVEWLEKEAQPSGAVVSSGKGDVLQSFAQEAAVAGLTRQEPVAARADARNWVIRSIDVAPAGHSLMLTFRGLPDQSATLRLDATLLRQWLYILYLGWQKAEWSPLVWPDWIKREESTPQDIVVH